MISSLLCSVRQRASGTSMSRDGLLPKLFSAVHPNIRRLLVHMDRLLRWEFAGS